MLIKRSPNEPGSGDAPPGGPAVGMTVEAAIEFLKNAGAVATEPLQAAGLYLVPQARFAKIKDDAAAKAAAEAQAARTALEKLQGEHAEAAKRLKAIDDQGKSAEDLWRDRQAEWSRQLQIEKDRATAAEQSAAKRTEAVRNLYRDRHLSALISAEAATPEAAEAARLLALQKFPSLVADDSGQLSYSDAAGIEHRGEEAAKALTAWWSTQKWAQRAPSPGPATGGGGPAPPPPDGPVYPPGASQADRIRLAAKWEEDRTAGRRR